MKTKRKITALALVEWFDRWVVCSSPLEVVGLGRLWSFPALIVSGLMNPTWTWRKEFRMRCSIPGDAGGKWLTELYVCGLQVYFDLSPCQDWMLSGATAQLLTLVIAWALPVPEPWGALHVSRLQRSCWVRWGSHDTEVSAMTGHIKSRGWCPKWALTAVRDDSSLWRTSLQVLSPISHLLGGQTKGS